LAKHGDPRWVDKLLLRQVAQRRIAVERLMGPEPTGAGVGDAAKPRLSTASAT